MKKIFRLALFAWLAVLPVFALRKPHVVSFGKWQTVKLLADAPLPKITEPSDVTGSQEPDGKGVDLRVRALYVDNQRKEETIGLPHEITDRIFVVRRAYRVNDSLPGEDSKGTQWRWQLGGWLEVDRVSGRVSALNLPEFDTSTSAAAWYRDYVGYCGVSDDGKKLHAIVAMLGRRKPIVKALIGNARERNGETDCDPPTWQRQPIGITFATDGGTGKVTYLVRGFAADLAPEELEEEVPSK